MKVFLNYKFWGLILTGFLMAAVISPGGVLAGDAGQTAAEVLRMGSGAARPAMGGAGLAAVSGPASLHYNPAGIALSRSNDLEFTYQQLVEDIGSGNLDYTYRINHWAAVAAGLRYVSYGSEKEIDYDGNILRPTGSSFSGSDIVGSFGYGERWYNLSWGTSVKLLSLKIDVQTALALAMDAGVQWRSPLPDLPLSAGLVLANLGTSVEFDSTSDDLPLLTRFGISYDWSRDRDLPIPVSTHLDFEYQINSGQTGVMAGLQWDVTDQVALRAGYDGNLDIDGGLTAGFGYQLDDSMVFDYAIVPYGELGNLHKIAFSYYLGE